MWKGYREVVILDFEWPYPADGKDNGELPKPQCMCAKELVSGRVHAYWGEDLKKLKSPPFDIGSDTVVVAYFAPAEASCFLELSWPRPANVIDLFAEDRAVTNGLLSRKKGQHSLIGACARRRVPTMLGADKEEARDLLRGRNGWTAAEQEHIIRYCGADVEATGKLFTAMEEAGEIDWDCALLRGRYGWAVASMQRVGVPIDQDTLTRLNENWSSIKLDLIRSVDSAYGVYEGTSFKESLFADYLRRQGIAWPLLESGRLSLGDGTFRDMARRYPQIMPLKELRTSL